MNTLTHWQVGGFYTAGNHQKCCFGDLPAVSHCSWDAVLFHLPHNFISLRDTPSGTTRTWRDTISSDGRITARRRRSRARQCEGRLHNTDIQSNKCLYVTSKSFSKHTCLSNLSQFYQLQKRVERGIKWSTCLNCRPVSLSVSLHGMLRWVVVTVSEVKSYKSILGFLTCFLKVTLLWAIENGYRSVKADEACENNYFSISKQFLLADFSSKTKNNKLKLFFTSTCWYVSVCLFKKKILPADQTHRKKTYQRPLWPEESKT